jgi:hypothetical protein
MSTVRAQSIRGRMAMLGLCVRQGAPWLAALRAELLSFPAGLHDDQVDALSLIGQLLDRVGAGPKLKLPKPPRRDDYRPAEQSGRPVAWATDGPVVAEIIMDRRGRPAMCVSDNGTELTGMARRSGSTGTTSLPENRHRMPSQRASMRACATSLLNETLFASLAQVLPCAPTSRTELHQPKRVAPRVAPHRSSWSDRRRAPTSCMITATIVAGRRLTFR